MKISAIVIAILALLLAFVLWDGVFVVSEVEQVIITQFGDPVGDPVAEPGLHFKLPIIQKANFFDKRFLEWDGDPNQIPTRDKRFIWVDTYARWRIADPLRFFQRLRDERGAQSRLDDILDGETRSAIARHDLVEVVRSSNRPPDEILVDSEGESAILEEIKRGRNDITREVLSNAQARAQDLGIELLDLRFKRINYVEEVQQDVFERMIAERERVAAEYLSEGEGEAARIRGERERELQKIRSQAYREAQEIQGKADAEATSIYAEAYNRDQGFYAFLKSMEMYEKTAGSDTFLIMTSDSEFLKYLKNSNPR
ncbi:MAG TPA: protease modulator HflC [Acidobacteriota bacterium]|nr:protease modulator HflC [Acidobacteriota bacterium]